MRAFQGTAPDTRLNLPMILLPGLGIFQLKLQHHGAEMSHPSQAPS